MPKAPSPIPRSEHERLLGAAPYVASVFFPILGPLVGLVVLQQSPYAKFHSLKCLRGELIMLLITTSIIVVSLSASIYGAIQVIAHGQPFDWVAMIVKSLVVWLLLALFGLWNTVSSILNAIRAYRG